MSERIDLAPHFRTSRIASLWTSEVFGALGTQVGFFVLPLAAVTLFDANALQVGALNSLDSVAALAFGLLAGVLIDKLGGARAVVVANIIRGVAALVMACAIVVTHHILLLYLAALLLGIGGLVNEAGLSTAVVELVGRTPRSLNRLNSLLRGTTSTAEVSGPGIAGLLVTLFGFGWASGSAALSFGAAALALLIAARSAVRVRASRALTGAAIGSRGPFALSGIRFIFRHRILRPLVLSSFHFNLFSAMVQSVFVIFCVRELHFSTLDIAILGVGGGVGAVAGSVLAASAHVARRGKRFYVTSLIVPGACVIAMVSVSASDSHFAQVVVVTASQAVWSAAMVVCIVLSNTIRQVQSPDALIGQIAASERLIAIAGELPGAAIGGLLGILFITTLPMVIGAIGMFTAAIWLARLAQWRELSVRPN